MDSILAEFDVNVCRPWDLNERSGGEGSGFVIDWVNLYGFLTRLEARLCTSRAYSVLHVDSPIRPI